MTLKNRREIVIQEMEALEAQGFGCKGCSGNCCTYEANSMMVTPLEALELMSYLKSSKLDTHELKAKIIQTISQFRLDRDLSTGKKAALRRTYTCPFFSHTELGCPLPRAVKPYGCLAFNSHHAELKADSNCFSDLGSLEKRESAHLEENKMNADLQNRFMLTWTKAPIPMAVLDLWEKDLTFFGQE